MFMASEDWPEIEQCVQEKRRELVIKGTADTVLKVEKLGGQLPKKIYQLELLNFLEVSGCKFEVLSEEVAQLKALTQFIISNNSIQLLPDGICTLRSLKILDVSYNDLQKLPDEFGELTNLQTLNANHNKLSEMPESVKKLSLLSTLDISNNAFATFPGILLEGSHTHLAEVKASHNEIADMDDGIGTLEALKTLDLSGNKLTELPQSLSGCLKLKQADYRDNPLKDRRLKKLIEQNNSSQKAIMDYIRTKGRPARKEGGGDQAAGGKSSGKKKKKGKNVKPEIDEELIKYIIQVLKFEDGSKQKEESAESPLEVVVSDEIKSVRPYIVCCIVKRLDLSKESTLKKFLAIQTKLHEDVCGKRTIATIASHDVPSLGGSSLLYDAKEPDTFKIQPLGRQDEVTGLKLYKRLRKEAEDMKKEKKRSQVSGIYKYLSLLETQEKFAYLSRSSDDVVVSFPPLTNSDVSKIKIGTNDVLLEVTGGQSLGSCKTVMDKLLRTMLDEGMLSERERDFYSDSSGEEEKKVVADAAPPKLVVQQVKVTDAHGKLKVLYPSRTDLEFSEGSIKVERPH